MIATIPFTPETVLVPRPTFESIADALEAYQETLQCMDASPEYELDRAECEQHIERLSEALLKKTDDLACVLRRMKADAGMLKAEETRLRERRTVVEASLDRLKSYTLVTMERHGFKHLKTAKNTIAIKGNGGVAPLVISQPELVPPEFCMYRLDLDYPAMNILMQTMEDYMPDHAVSQMEQRTTRTPSQSLIREALIQPCATCDGTGVYDVEFQCADCGGTGKASVPGAHLEPRGVHIETR